MIMERFPTRDDSVSNHVWNVDDFRESDGIVIEATRGYYRSQGNSGATRDFSSTMPRKISTCDFSIPQPDIADVALVIGENRLHVSKQLLAVHSPVFRAMFFTDFVEKDKKEITIEDIVLDEFVEFLHVIYPSRKPITVDALAAANLEFFLKLGDRFNSEFVLHECEAFLCSPAGNKLPLEKRLLYADRFGLSRLQVHFLDSIKTLNEAKAMHGTGEFEEFSDKMKAPLLEKIFKLG